MNNLEKSGNEIGNWVSDAGSVIGKTLDFRTTGLIHDAQGTAAISSGAVVASTAPPATAPAGGVSILGGGVDGLLGVGFDVLGHEGSLLK